MALPKDVKIGGSYYKGHKLVVSATPGDYILDMSENIKSVINGITLIPDVYGIGDYMKLEHLDSDNKLIDTIADTVYNIGANAAWLLDFSALERMEEGDKLRLTYTNVAGEALNVYTTVERIR